jgi:hypothetical protein
VGKVREIERWRTPNGGRTWLHRAITRKSPVDNVRPVVPRGLAAGKREVVWMRGVYDRYTAFQTSIRAFIARSSPWPAADFKVTANGSRTLRLVRTAEPGGTPPASVRWDFGDGSSGLGDQVTHRYVRPGKQFVKLTVRDAFGRRDVFVQEISVRL